ncbi:MAG TPA: RdgB/HAM1 family non-canonical purine NTP pyrophosphatase [Chthoniobacterales bacterium]|nr:RdgB/HAM1 family non-canonical purine NTP pyrophosphatase [Chthoniobacterales bacterium]HXY61230.1 RdgB/HAM1 family non-canonical purine NTP pyrophosphatase [Chthoniobacterales bacterium]
MFRLLLATRNPHKLREFSELLGDGFQIRDLSGLEIPALEETGTSFEENAISKAIAVSRQLAETSRRDVQTVRAGVEFQCAFPALVIADDSGLEVESLNGAPGVFSARYAGENATDQANVEKLLGMLRGKADRMARFQCVVALARDGRLLGTFNGEVEGTVVDLPRGAQGFGYDPIFLPSGFNQTFGEMTPILKNQISHRAKAIAALTIFLQRQGIGHQPRG